MAADIIDLKKRRSSGKAPQPAGNMTFSCDVDPGVVTVTITTPDGDFAFGVSPDGARQMAHRLEVAAMRARLREEGGEHG